jgi:hypothetical protein
MTVRHLLTMTAGLDWDEAKSYGDTTNTAIQLEGSYDWVKFAIDRPMSEEPGTRFNYNSGATELLAHVFRRATASTSRSMRPAALRPDRHHRLALEAHARRRGRHRGRALPALEDLARIWYLFLRGGTWTARRS